MSARFGEYVIERQLAVGGMAEVFLARKNGPAGFEKKVVIKRILPHLANDDRFISMFLDEARLAARLQHPNIAQIFDLGDVGGAYFIAMEYVPGHSLNGLLSRAREHSVRVPVRVAARIASRICAGLRHAHELKDENHRGLGIVHRDVSPHNVLLTPGGQVKIIDFGVARATANDVDAQADVVKGKFAYMSPEQIMGKRLDGRSDIFSVGIVLYELATGGRPFGETDDLSTVTTIVHEPHRPPGDWASDFPDDLLAVLDKALMKDRNRRYRRVREMERDLERFISESGDLVDEEHIGSVLSALLDDPTSLPALAGAAPAAEPAAAPEPATAPEPAADGPRRPTIDLHDEPIEAVDAETALLGPDDNEAPVAQEPPATPSRASRAQTLILNRVEDAVAAGEIAGNDQAPATRQSSGLGWVLLVALVVLIGILIAWGVGLFAATPGERAEYLAPRVTLPSTANPPNGG